MNQNTDYHAYLSGWEEKIGAFLELSPPHAACDRPPHGTGLTQDEPGRNSADIDRAKRELSGLPFAVKDNIAVAGWHLTCGSRLLAGLVSPYTATAVSRVLEAGGKIAGKTNMDEFGMGSSTDASALKQTNNPWDTSRVAGGSSGGSAAAVAC